MGNNWRLLITRPAADNAVLGRQLADAGVFSHSLPLLEMQPLSETPAQRSLMMNLDRYSTLVVVSKPAARYALERLDRYWPQPPLRPHWFSVGAATGQILRDHGLPADWPLDGDDSEALLALPAFQASLQQPSPRVLIMRADNGRDFLANTLGEQGIEVDFLPLYKRFMPEYPAGILVESIHQHQLNALAISSEQGLSNLIALAAGDWPELARLPLFVPSPRVAASARQQGARQVIDCAGASNQALLDALQRTPQPIR